MQRADSLEKTLMLVKIEGWKRGDRVWDGWMQHRHNGHEFEQILGDSEGEGSLAWWSSWGHRIGYDLAIEQQQSFLSKTFSMILIKILTQR